MPWLGYGVLLTNRMLTCSPKTWYRVSGCHLGSGDLIPDAQPVHTDRGRVDHARSRLRRTQLLTSRPSVFLLLRCLRPGGSGSRLMTMAAAGVKDRKSVV